MSGQKNKSNDNDNDNDTCVPFWLNQPTILWIQANEFFPFTENDRRCTAAALNSFTRFALYLGLVLALVKFDPLWLLIGVVGAVFSVGVWLYMDHKGAVREGFQIPAPIPPPQIDRMGETNTVKPIVDNEDVIGQYLPDVIGIEGRTFPTKDNPFMNVMLTEIGDNPYRSPAANTAARSVKTELDAFFRTLFINDPDDVFQHTQSQRMWVTMPSTTVPNDQGAFADWLYRVPGQTCKEGNLAACAGVFSTGAEALPWRDLRKLT